MSLYESGDSTGQISLQQLFQGKIETTQNETLNIEDLAFLICRGG